MPEYWDKWQAPDRDSPSSISFEAEAKLGEQLGVLLKMEGANGLDDAEVLRVTGQNLSRARRWHKFFERMGLLYQRDGVTRLTPLGLAVRDADAEAKRELT